MHGAVCVAVVRCALQWCGVRCSGAVCVAIPAFVAFSERYVRVAVVWTQHPTFDPRYWNTLFGPQDSGLSP